MTNRPATQDQVELAANQVERVTSPARPAPTKPLQEVVDAVRIDSLVSPVTYLDETKVPHGGE